MKNYSEPCLQLDSDISVEETTNKVFVVGHKFILSDFKKLARAFGLKCNFFTPLFGR